MADTMLPHAQQVADPFHVVGAANDRLDEVRRRVRTDKLGQSGTCQAYQRIGARELFRLKDLVQVIRNGADDGLR